MFNTNYLPQNKSQQGEILAKVQIKHVAQEHPVMNKQRST